MIAQGLWFSDAKYLGEIPTASPPTKAPNRGGSRLKAAIFDQYLLYLRNGTSY